MHSSIRRVCSAARACKKAIWSCLRRIPLLGSRIKRKKCARRGDHDMAAMVQIDDLPTTGESREAIVNESSGSATMELQTDLKTVACVHREHAIPPNSANGDRISAVECDEKPKNGKRARRTRRKNVESQADTQVLPTESAVGEASPKTKEALDADEGGCGPETQADSVSRAPPTQFVPHSTRNEQEDPCKSQNGKKAKRSRRKKNKSAVDDISLPAASIAEEKSLRAEHGLDVKSSENREQKTPPPPPPTVAPAITTASNNVAVTCKSRVAIAVDKRPANDGQLSERWRIVGRTRTPRTSQPDDALCAKDDWRRQRVNGAGLTFRSRFEANGNDNNKPFDAFNGSGDTAVTKSSGWWRCSNNKSGEKRNNGERFMAARPRQDDLSSTGEIELNKAENAWIPKVVAKKTGGAESSDTKREQEKTEELIRSVNSVLNKLAPENIVRLTETFAVLPIDTIERLESTIDLVFEKAIREKNFAPLYASLCSAMESVQVTCDDGKNTVTFKTQLLRKCQRQFEADRVRRTDDVKKLEEINSCRDSEKNKELLLEYEEIERRSRERSVGNCRFIGELFKQNVVRTNIMMFCMTNLVGQNSEESLECLCNLLKIAGKQLEQCCSLKDIFDKLKCLTSDKNVSSRMRFMIQDVMDLRRNKWLPRETVNR